MAQKWGIPVVSTAFIEDSVAAGKLLEADNFTVAGKTASEQLSSGKIVGQSVNKHTVVRLAKKVG